MNQEQIAAIVAQVVAQIGDGDSGDDLYNRTDPDALRQTMGGDDGGQENAPRPAITRKQAEEIKAKIAAAPDPMAVMEALGDHVPTSWNREQDNEPWVRFANIDENRGR